MRKYHKSEEKKLIQVVCNKCGRSLRLENGCLKEGCFSAAAAFGYFTRKDGTVHRFDLCEDCYDSIVSQFAVPVEEETVTELL